MILKKLDYSICRFKCSILQRSFVFSSLSESISCFTAEEPISSISSGLAANRSRIWYNSCKVSCCTSLAISVAPSPSIKLSFSKRSYSSVAIEKCRNNFPNLTIIFYLKLSNTEVLALQVGTHSTFLSSRPTKRSLPCL